MYYNARYYDPALGRFITADSIVPGAGNTQAYNRYMYVVGNPITYSDPTGHFSWKKLGKIIKGVAVTGVVGGAPVTVAYVLGGTHGKPWKADKWEHFDSKRAKEYAIITIAAEAIVVATVVAPEVSGATFVSGGINAYFNCRDGGSFQDIFVSFAIGYTVACFMPISSGTPLMDAILIGACRGAITNTATQSYNMSFAEKTHQDKFSVGSLAFSIATGAVSGALDHWNGLFGSTGYDSFISATGDSNIMSVYEFKALTLMVIGMEEMIYWSQRQNN